MIDEKLIDLVEDNPCLFDKSDKYFKCNDSKADAWHRIGKTLEVDGNYAMKRWNNIRDRFSKEVRISNQASESGDSNIKPWHLFDRLSFLRRHVIPRPMRQSTRYVPNYVVAEMPTPSLFEEVYKADADTLASQPNSPASSKSSSPAPSLLLPDPSPPRPAPAINRRKRRAERLDEVDAALLKTLKAYEHKATAANTAVDGELRAFSDMICASIAKIKDRRLQLDIMQQCTALVMEAQKKELENENNITINMEPKVYAKILAEALAIKNSTQE